MKTFKIKMSFIVRAEDDDSDSIREAVKEKLEESVEHDEFKFTQKEIDSDEDEEDEDA